MVDGRYEAGALRACQSRACFVVVNEPRILETAKIEQARLIIHVQLPRTALVAVSEILPYSILQKVAASLASSHATQVL